MKISIENKAIHELIKELKQILTTVANSTTFKH